MTANIGHDVAESIFYGTRPRLNKVIEALGAEVIGFAERKIKEMGDYHRPLPANAASADSNAAPARVARHLLELTVNPARLRSLPCGIRFLASVFEW